MIKVHQKKGRKGQGKTNENGDLIKNTVRLKKYLETPDLTSDFKTKDYI